MTDLVLWKEIGKLIGAGFLTVILLYMIFNFIIKLWESKIPMNGSWKSDFNRLETKVDNLHKEFHARMNHHENIHHGGRNAPDQQTVRSDDQ